MTIEEQALALIAKKARRPAEQLAPAMTFAELGIDSLSAIELVFKFEDTFNITIPDAAVQQMRTVGDVIATLRTALASDGSSAA